MAWVDGPVREKWGPKAAARAFHIALEGCDAEILGNLGRAVPSQVPVKAGRRVPGAIAPAKDAFAVSQALSWLAKERSDVGEQTDWKRQIQVLINAIPQQT